MKTKLTVIFLCLGLVAMLPASAVRAADTEKSLQKRFEERLDKIRKLKASGTIGETYKGYVDFVKEGDGDDAAKQVVQDENADRESLYKLIAKRTETTPEKVAERNAKRNFEKAKAG